MILFQGLAGTNNHKYQENFLRSETHTLEKLKTMAQQYVAAESAVKGLKDSSSVCKTNTEQDLRNRNNGNDRKPPSQAKPNQQAQNDRDRCWRCNTPCSTQHTADTCYHKNSKCINCGEMGHNKRSSACKQKDKDTKTEVKSKKASAKVIVRSTTIADHPAEPHTLSDPNTKQATVAKIDSKESKKLDHIKKPVGPAEGIPVSTLAIMDKYCDVFYDYEPRVQSSLEEGGESRTGKGFFYFTDTAASQASMPCLW